MSSKCSGPWVEVSTRLVDTRPRGTVNTDGNLIPSGLWFSLIESILKGDTPFILVFLGILGTGLLDVSVVVTMFRYVESCDSVDVSNYCN